MNKQRFRSLSEIKNSSELRIPIFDKESSDFLFEKSREILSRPLNRERSAEEPKSINDNIMDIENTLKALNLDFMHTYTELDKSDSNDTILNDQLPQLLGSLDDGISSATGSLKSAVYSYSNGVQTMFDFNAATSHLDKHLQYMHNQAQLHSQSQSLASATEQKLLDDKRSSTPDTGFASRDTNISLSRRSSQKSSYSPQESYFPMKSEALYSAPPVVMSSAGYERFGNGHTKQMLASASPVKSACLNAGSSSAVYAVSTKSYRQRSTSFNESFQPISPEQRHFRAELHHQQQQQQLQQHHLQMQQQQQQQHHQMPLPRRTASYKPRSIRARTLRRLSYNPMTLDSSSSSSGGEESNNKPSLARSECDIRARVAATSSNSLCRRRRAGLSRQVQSACHDEREAIISQRQLYGSNSSIKSAPHYNLGGGNRRSYHRPGAGAGSGYEQFNYDERIYDFGGRGPGNNYTAHLAQHALLAPTQSLKLSSGSGSSSAASSAVATYRTASAPAARPVSGATLHEFDISRLTGKSPTSTNFVGSSPDEVKKPQRPTEFHWPEKIHVSTVKQHEMHWRQLQQQQQQQSQPAQPQLPLVTTAVRRDSSDSSSSSSTESGDEFQFRREFTAPRIPPSPAP